jgi:hypothetical protein
MKVPQDPARKASRSARSQRKRELQPKTSDLLPSIDWIRPKKPKAKKPRRDRKSK